MGNLKGAICQCWRRARANNLVVAPPLVDDVINFMNILCKMGGVPHQVFDVLLRSSSNYALQLLLARPRGMPAAKKRNVLKLCKGRRQKHCKTTL
jgi:hypothetical protein